MLSWKITTCVTAIVHSFFCLVEHRTIYHLLGRLGCREGDRHPQQEGAQKDIGQLFRETSTLPRWKDGSCRRCPGWWPTSWSVWTTGRDWFGSVWYGWIGIGLRLYYILEWSDKIGRNMSELDVVAICFNLRLQVPLLLQLVARRC